MLQAYIGEDLTVGFPFIVEGEFVIPDSAAYKMRDNSGVVLSSSTITIGPSDTQTVISVLAVNNTVAPGLDFENRSLELIFSYQGNSYRQVKNFRVIPWVNITTIPLDTRVLWGVMDSELADDDIDIFQAYLEVRDAVGANVLASALSSGSLLSIAANRAIACKAALNAGPTLRMRVSLSRQSDVTVFERYATANLDDIEEKILDFYAGHIADMLPLVQPITPAFLLSSCTIDPLTGR